MSPEITREYFKYSFNEPTSYGFHGLNDNYFVDSVLSKRKDNLSIQIIFRLLRAGLLGDILYQASLQTVEDIENDAGNELLSCLFESYIVLARSIYDYLLFFLEEEYNVKERSFNKFLKKVENGEYSNIDAKFRKHLNNKIFSKLRNLRDSSVHKTANIFIYVKNKKYRVEANVYKDNGQPKEKLDESLHVLMFLYTSGLVLLMAYIAEKATGKTIKEQTGIQKQKRKEDLNN